jgi:hypothetical protein
MKFSTDISTVVVGPCVTVAREDSSLLGPNKRQKE